MNDHTELPEADKNFVGEVFESNNYGKFCVVRRAPKNEWSRETEPMYWVRFLETGTKKLALKSDIRLGKVRDPYHPNICGVGCKGQTRSRDSSGDIKSSYSRWKHMIRRCYNSQDKSYKNYGGRGIKVCDRWHCFENYEQDVTELPGYDDPEKTTIDRIDNDGDYSPGNCRWATRHQQRINSRPDGKRVWFIAVSPDGERYRSNNQHEFAREHGLQQPNIGHCLAGRAKTHKGWRFEYEE